MREYCKVRGNGQKKRGTKGVWNPGTKRVKSVAK